MHEAELNVFMALLSYLSGLQLKKQMVQVIQAVLAVAMILLDSGPSADTRLPSACHLIMWTRTIPFRLYQGIIISPRSALGLNGARDGRIVDA